MKQSANVIATSLAIARRLAPTAAGGSIQGAVFQLVNVMTLAISVHAIQIGDSVLSRAAAVVAVSPAVRAQGRDSSAWAM